MTESYVLSLAQNAVTVMLILAGPILLVSLIVGSSDIPGSSSHPDQRSNLDIYTKDCRHWLGSCASWILDVTTIIRFHIKYLHQLTQFR